MGSNRWTIERAGLINFWYYDEEEFTFSDGKLLLRGSNGSGKSVTMQSFIPLLLDGNKSPQRLDPFGSNARKLENYLLGEDGDKDENTAYLYMEFVKPETKNCITIGLGLKAQRGKSLQSWGFAITDGRRIGQDFYLYKNMGEKIPLSKKELENRIGDGGRVLEGQGDYMKLVNDLLFGFDEIDEYDELVRLLVQLRSPKLSKEFKPTAVYEIMENSLQQLSEDDLRPMSEAIENMDNIKSRLEELKESKKAADRIRDAYDKYNRFILSDKARAYVNVQNEYEKLIKDKAEIENKRDAAKREFETSGQNVDELKIKQKTTQEKKKQLDAHDSIRIKERMNEIEKENSGINLEIREKEAQLDLKKSRERQLYSQVRDVTNTKEQSIKNISNKLDEMDGTSEDFAFDEHTFMRSEIERDMESPYDFGYVETRLREHAQNIETAREALKEYASKNREYDGILGELEKSRQEVEIKSKRVDEAGLLLSEVKEELIEKVYSWNNSNTALKLSKECLISLSRNINSFGEGSSFDDIISIVRGEYNHYEGEGNKKLSHLRFIEENFKKEQKSIEDEINEWKNKKDPEPERNERVIMNRKKLEAEGIPYIPLYKAVDFIRELSDETRGRLEEALVDMGLIDALIIPPSYKNKVLEMDINMADKYIFPSPKYLMHDLSELLKPENIEVKGITSADIDNVLKSILLDEGTTYLNEDGEYGIGIIRGKTSRNYSAKFIGASARKSFREQMILELTEKYSLRQQEIDGIKGEAEKIIKELRILGEEFGTFPKSTDITTAVHELKDAEFNLRKAKEELVIWEGREKTAYEGLKEIQQKVYELTHKINLKADIEIYSEAYEASKEYREMLFQLKEFHTKLIQSIENLGRLNEEREGLETDIENLISDISIKERKQKELKALYEGLSGQLKLSNYEEVEKEIEECLRILDEIPPLLESEIDKRAKMENEYKRSIDEISGKNREIGQKSELLEVYRASFVEEYNLKCVEEPVENEDNYKSAQRIIREIKFNDKYQRDDYINQLYAKFQENSQYLREYIVKIDNIFEKQYEEENQEIADALSKSKRLYITGKVRGKDVDFYSLIDFIKEGMEENERLLRESDRQLFEDILVKNISKKIRAKIYHSEKWVKQMNELMESMNTSSGLSFSLRWSSKKAETEEQMDTKELVELLKQEGSLMKESDLNKLSEHFRSKISEARRVQEDTGKTQTFHSIMREILDYRKWFEFKLYYTKTGQAKKELTNNAFFQFSGGEKAMAMYVPLFSAVYARYEGARRDCPRLISLDEAFAGVDEKNIRDMFRLLRELDLDFIINSQILWGDYDTVPSLSISELVRPDNVDFVTVIRYHWNGKVKELLV